MAIHLYLDEQLTQQISEGDFSNPDADNYNGTDGEIKDRQIFVANEQTTLAAPIDDVQTDIELTEPRLPMRNTSWSALSRCRSFPVAEPPI